MFLHTTLPEKEPCKGTYLAQRPKNTLEFYSDVGSPTFYKDIIDTVSKHMKERLEKEKPRKTDRTRGCYSVHLHIPPEICPRLKFTFAMLNITGYYRTWSIIKIVAPPGKNDKGTSSCENAQVPDNPRVCDIVLHKDVRYLELHISGKNSKNSKNKKGVGDIIKIALVKDHLIPALAAMYPTKTFKWGPSTKKGIFSVITVGTDALYMTRSQLSNIIS